MIYFRDYGSFIDCVKSDKNCAGTMLEVAIVLEEQMVHVCGGILSRVSTMKPAFGNFNLFYSTVTFY